MTGERRGFSRNALHQIAVANQRVGVMINNLVAWSVVTASEVIFRDRHSNAIGESLAQRTCGHLYPWRQSVFGMTGRSAAPFTKLFDLFEWEIIASEVEQTIEQHRSMSGGQDKTIAIRPTWIGRIMFEKPRPKHIGHWSSAHRQAGMTAVCFLHRVHRQETDRVD